MVTLGDVLAVVCAGELALALVVVIRALGVVNALVRALGGVGARGRAGGTSTPPTPEDSSG